MCGRSGYRIGCWSAHALCSCLYARLPGTIKQGHKSAMRGMQPWTDASNMAARGLQLPWLAFAAAKFPAPSWESLLEAFTSAKAHAKFTSGASSTAKAKAWTSESAGGRTGAGGTPQEKRGRVADQASLFSSSGVQSWRLWSVASCRARPGSASARGRLVPSRRNGLTSVASTATCTPPKPGSLFATTSRRRPSDNGMPRLRSRRKA